MSRTAACVIVNYDRPDDTVRCVRSLRANAAETRVIVVDNGSRTQAELGERLAPDGAVVWMPFDANLGFAAGSNRGIARALEMADVAFIMLLNNDAWVVDDAVARLVACAERHPDAGLFAPKIYYPDGRTLWAAGGVYNYWRITGSNRGDGTAEHGRYDRPGPVGFVSACAVLIRRSVFESIGLFDERFFTYYEDLDFSLRARARGYTLWYCPDAHVMHEGSATAGAKYGVFASYYRYRNRLLVIRKHANVWQALFNVVFLPLLAVRDFCTYVIKGRFAAYRQLWAGAWDLVRTGVATEAKPPRVRSVKP